MSSRQKSQTAEAAEFWDSQRSSPAVAGAGAAAAAYAAAADDKRSLDVLNLRSESDLRRFVSEVHKSVEAARHGRQSDALKAALEESRDAVLKQAREAAARSSVGQQVYPRLPSNNSVPPEELAELYCIPCNSGGSKATGAENNANDENNNDSIVVKVRSAQKIRSVIPQVASPTLYLEGTHPSRPPSTATVFLRKHYLTEDEQSLKYVPYFGDDDKEDVVSELFDINHRANLMEFGPEYEERDMNDEVDETLQELVEQAGKRILQNTKKGTSSNHDEDIVRQMIIILADVMDVNAERINERYKLCWKSSSQQQQKNGFSGASKSSSTGAASTDADTSSEEEAEGKSSTEAHNSCAAVPLSYEDVMDSYRNLFCRRCFTYDCNFHGNLAKPDIHLQGELAVQREKDGFWDKSESLLSEEEMKSLTSETDKTGSKNAISSPSRKRSRSSLSTKDSATASASGESLTPLQLSICEHVYMMFQGDVEKMASAMGADQNLVERYVTEKKLELKEPTLLPASGSVGKARRKDASSEYTSMKNYNVAWLKNVQDAEIHPAFLPCDHEGPCNEETCSCVKNAFFCTKHCVWGERSRNFFRGCACKGICNTKSCACFAAKRECDPDLCRTCGACSDPPNKPATKQRCKNDNLSMRRHAHLLVAESTIPDAGWGIFTKHALKKGDFVHEYVGEVISQEEAERRGRIYDKVNCSYLFNLCSDFVVDASRKGNKTKFANHSSKPNCCTKMVMVNGDSRIGLFAKCDIEAQSELFFDYRYDVGIDNDLIIKPAKNVDWMNDPKMANKVSKKYADIKKNASKKHAA